MLRASFICSPHPLQEPLLPFCSIRHVFHGSVFNASLRGTCPHSAVRRMLYFPRTTTYPFHGFPFTQTPPGAQVPFSSGILFCCRAPCMRLPQRQPPQPTQARRPASLLPAILMRNAKASHFFPLTTTNRLRSLLAPHHLRHSQEGPLSVVPSLHSHSHVAPPSPVTE